MDELGLSAQENRPKRYPVDAKDVQCSGETIEICVITRGHDIDVARRQGRSVDHGRYAFHDDVVDPFLIEDRADPHALGDRSRCRPRARPR